MVDLGKLVLCKRGVFQHSDVIEDLLGLGGADQHACDRIVAVHPRQRHLRQALSTRRGDRVQLFDAFQSLLAEVFFLQKSAVRTDTAVGGNSLQIAVGQHSLRERAENDQPLLFILARLQQPVFLYGAVDDGKAVLIDHKGTLQLLQYFCGSPHGLAVVIGKPHVQRFSAFYNAVERSHGLLKGRFLIHAVVVENIHIIQAHTFEALVKACHQILFAAEIAVRPRPHIISRLGADDHFIAVGGKFLFQDLSEVFLCRAGCGAVIVCKVKMRNAVIKCNGAHICHVFVQGIVAEVVPQSEGNGGKLQPAVPAAIVLHILISVSVGFVIHNIFLSCSRVLFVLQLRCVGVDEGEGTGIALDGAFFCVRTAGRADAPVGFGAVEIERVGQSVKFDDALSLMVVEIKAVFLLETQSFGAPVVQADAQRGVGAKIVVCRCTVGVGGAGVGMGDAGGDHGAHTGAVGQKLPQLEDENAADNGGKHANGKFPPDDAAIIGVGLMIVIIGDHAADDCRAPQGKAEQAQAIALVYVTV